jgi:hypothetical protein
MKTLQGVVSRGQHTHADGLFFGGTEPTWSNTTVRSVLRKYASRCQQLAWIDVHTGLGPRGVGERIFAGKNDPAAYARADTWWSNRNNPSGQTLVTSMYDGSSTSAFLTGLMTFSVYEECPQAQFTAMAMEYGTQPMEQVMQALRADHWLHQHPEAPTAQRKQIKAQILEAFYCDADDWKGMVISQARQALFQTVQGLSGLTA